MMIPKLAKRGQLTDYPRLKPQYYEIIKWFLDEAKERGLELYLKNFARMCARVSVRVRVPGAGEGPLLVRTAPGPA